jgi:hypothetical protein
VVTVKVGPKVAVLMTPFVLEEDRADCKDARELKHGQRVSRHGVQ